jgi:hypothetical protein
MKTIRRLIYGEVMTAVAFVLLAFLSLFFFFDFIDEPPLGAGPGPRVRLEACPDVRGFAHAKPHL